MTAPGLREKSLARLECRVVVLLAAQRGSVGGGPLRAGTPGVDVHKPVGHGKPNRRRTMRRARRAPHLVPPQPDRGSGSDRSECQREVERSLRSKPRTYVGRLVVSGNAAGSP